ncbi:MAG: LPS export ABC transporter periplasmic protein LptC [Thioalkalispiraceae bacterium]|jgi:lipopolysaccharide export system protein LptC
MGKVHYIIVLIVVLAIATLTYQLSTSVDKSIETTDPSLRHDPDYFISNFKATMYDKDGAANYHMNAEYLEHFPDTETLEVKKIEVVYIDQTQQTWRVTADTGIGYEKTEILHVAGNVKVHRITPDPEKNLLLETQRLRIDFPAKLADTESEVKITGKNSTINAVGMDINLVDGTMTLRSEARGQYVPR